MKFVSGTLLLYNRLLYRFLRWIDPHPLEILEFSPIPSEIVPGSREKPSDILSSCIKMSMKNSIKSALPWLVVVLHGPTYGYTL